MQILFMQISAKKNSIRRDWENLNIQFNFGRNSYINIPFNITQLKF